MLGMVFDAEPIHQWRQSLKAQHEYRRRRKDAKRHPDTDHSQEWDYFLEAMGMEPMTAEEPPQENTVPLGLF